MFELMEDHSEEATIKVIGVGGGGGVVVAGAAVVVGAGFGAAAVVGAAVVCRCWSQVVVGASGVWDLCRFWSRSCSCCWCCIFKCCVLVMCFLSVRYWVVVGSYRSVLVVLTLNVVCCRLFIVDCCFYVD